MSAEANRRPAWAVGRFGSIATRLLQPDSVTGALYTCRLDLVGFVNGLPLVVIELKKPGVPARVAFDENLTHYRERDDTSPRPSPWSRRRGRCCSGSTRR